MDYLVKYKKSKGEKKMNENTITITLEEYRNLIAMAERIAVVSRMLGSTNYVNVDDIKAVLDINVREEACDETI